MPQTPTGTIAIAAGSDLRYQGEVRFDVTTDNFHGNQYPMVYVTAYQNDVLVYGQLDHPDVIFVLGGGSSDWVTAGGGAAHCRAELRMYDNHNNQPVLASVEFEAAA